MHRRWLINLLLLSLVAGLLLFMLLQPEPDHSASTSLTALKPDAIHTIRIKRRNNKTVVLKRGKSGWRLVAPQAARSHTRNVTRLLQISSAAARPIGVIDSRNRAKFGLDKPLATLWLNDTEIRFGAAHPLNNLQYVGVQNKVNLISLNNFYVIANPLTALLSPRLLAANERPVDFRFPAHRLWLVQGQWRRQPTGEKTGPTSLARWVQDWRQATAQSVKPYAGKPAIDRVTITVADDKTGKRVALKFDVLAYRPAFILHRRDERLEYRFPAEIGRRLMP